VFYSSYYTGKKVSQVYHENIVRYWLIRRFLSYLANKIYVSANSRFSLYSAVYAFSGAILLYTHYVVLCEKPHFQKVVCQFRLGGVDSGKEEGVDSKPSPR
jgi:hypothetical protein